MQLFYSRKYFCCMKNEKSTSLFSFNPVEGDFVNRVDKIEGDSVSNRADDMDLVYKGSLKGCSNTDFLS